MSNMSQLGFYSYSEKALIAKNLAVALSVVLVPRMSKLACVSNSSKFNELLDKSIEIILLLTIVFDFGTAAVSRVFSVVFGGDEFADCSILIQIMSITLPSYGAFGAAFATLVTQYVVLIVECIAICKNYSVFNAIRRSMPYVFFAIVMYVSVKFIDRNVNGNLIYLVSEVLLGILIFLSLCIIYWIISNQKEYLNILKSIVKKVLPKKNFMFAK